MPRRSLKRYLIGTIWIIGFSLIGAGEAVIIQSPAFDRTMSGEIKDQTADKFKSCRSVPPLALAWVPIRTRICVGFFRNIRFFDVYHDTINAISTLLVAIFTFTLWRTTGMLFFSATKDRELSENTSQRQLRAYIGVDSACIRSKTDTKIVIQYNVKNYGQTPAFDVIFICSGHIQHVSGSRTYEQPGAKGVIHWPGHTKTIIQNIDINPGEIDNITINDSIEILYNDSFGFSQKTSYAHINKHDQLGDFIITRAVAT